MATDQTRPGRTRQRLRGVGDLSRATANNVILFARSTDHGMTYSKPIAMDKGLSEKQFADLASGLTVPST